MVNPSQQSFVDLSQLEYLMGVSDQDLVHELINVYLADTPKRLEDLDQASKTKRWREMSIIAHTLKSSSRTFGATQMADLCEALEREGKQGSISGAVTKVTALKTIYQAIAQELEQELTKNGH